MNIRRTRTGGWEYNGTVYVSERSAVAARLNQEGAPAQPRGAFWQGLFRWVEGRQGSGYYKMKLFESRWLRADMYLLKYPKGSYISPHTDPAPKGFKHKRLNLVLKKAASGGRFKMDGDFYDNRAVVFRPDDQVHEVTKIDGGCRWVLSLGKATSRD